MSERSNENETKEKMALHKLKTKNDLIAQISTSANRSLDLRWILIILSPFLMELASAWIRDRESTVNTFACLSIGFIFHFVRKERDKIDTKFKSLLKLLDIKNPHETLD